MIDSPHATPAFTLDEHISRSLSALPAVLAQTKAGIVEKVTCHHFEFFGGENFEDVVDASDVEVLAGRLRQLAIILDLPLLEAADWVIPDLPWVERTIPKIVEIAAAAGLNYAGWTWEPRAIQPIGTTAFAVINNRSPQGRH